MRVSSFQKNHISTDLNTKKCGECGGYAICEHGKLKYIVENVVVLYCAKMNGAKQLKISNIKGIFCPVL